MSFANKYATAKKIADKACEKIKLADEKRQEVEESLCIALESLSAAKERAKVFEGKLAEAKKSAFDRGRKEAELDIASRLTRIYNESFQEGWKAVLRWSEPGEVPFLPPRDMLPYPDTPIGVEEEVNEDVPPTERPSAPEGSFGLLPSWDFLNNFVCCVVYPLCNLDLIYKYNIFFMDGNSFYVFVSSESVWPYFAGKFAPVLIRMAVRFVFRAIT